MRARARDVSVLYAPFLAALMKPLICIASKSAAVVKSAANARRYSRESAVRITGAPDASRVARVMPGFSRETAAENGRLNEGDERNERDRGEI